MKERNIYKEIVFGAMGCMLIALAVQAVKFWLAQQKVYEIMIQSQTELTEGTVKELAKIEGLYQFNPMSSCQVTLRLDEYTLEATLTGIEIDRYPLSFQAAQEEIVLGNTPVLFLGKEAFAAFVDSNGNGPGKSRIAQWTEKYQDLELAIADEGGKGRGAKIGGILAQPVAGIYIDGKQMQSLYGEFAETYGGCAKIQGRRNMEKAQEILSGAGFRVE